MLVKKVIILLLSFFVCSSAMADYVLNRANMPQGTFKKKRNGTIVQYDKKGKKIGVYKLSRGTYIKIK